jgi:HNH endonuclease
VEGKTEKEVHMATTDQEVQERLLGRREVDSNGCWRYTGASAGNGYGWTWYRGRNEYAHRVSAIIFLEYDPRSRLWVCHTCDTPICFNPDHLFIGTPRDNMRDAATKGRMTGKKLAAPQVARIKYLLSQGATQRRLAVEYGVSTTAIGQIARAQTWREVEPAKADDAQPEEVAG